VGGEYIGERRQKRVAKGATGSGKVRGGSGKRLEERKRAPSNIRGAVKGTARGHMEKKKKHGKVGGSG